MATLALSRWPPLRAQEWWASTSNPPIGKLIWREAVRVLTSYYPLMTTPGGRGGVPFLPDQKVNSRIKILFLGILRWASQLGLLPDIR
jgi:hypothetical protein